MNICTGEIANKLIAEHHFCKTIIYQDTEVVLFQGSIHKLWNSLNNIDAPNDYGKGFNGNNFTSKGFKQVKEYLCTLFNCTLLDFEFQNIEIGYNILIPFNPYDFIKGVLYHKGKLFEYRYNENYCQVEHQQYRLKIYNKSNQYNLDNHTIRIELKYNKMKPLKKEVNINTLADINPATISKAKEELIKKFEEVVYYDYTIRKKELTNKDRTELKNYSNPRYWINELTTEKRKVPQRNLKKIIQSNSDNFKKTIIKEINKIEIIPNTKRSFQNIKNPQINRSSIGLNKGINYTNTIR